MILPSRRGREASRAAGPRGGLAPPHGHNFHPVKWCRPRRGVEWFGRTTRPTRSRSPALESVVRSRLRRRSTSSPQLHRPIGDTRLSQAVRGRRRPEVSFNRNSAGAIACLHAKGTDGLQLQRSVKTLRLSKYLGAYPNFFRLETHGDGLNHVYPVTAPRAGVVVEAPELPLFTPGGGDSPDAVWTYRERLRLDGCGPGVLPLMSPADLVDRYGIPHHMAEQLVKEARQRMHLDARSLWSTCLLLMKRLSHERLIRSAGRRNQGPRRQAPWGSSGGMAGAAGGGSSSSGASRRRGRGGCAPMRHCTRGSWPRALTCSCASRPRGARPHCLENPRTPSCYLHARCGGCLRGAGLGPTCPTCRGVISGTLAVRWDWWTEVPHPHPHLYPHPHAGSLSKEAAQGGNLDSIRRRYLLTYHLRLTNLVQYFVPA